MPRKYKQRARIDVPDRIMARIEYDGDCWIFTGGKHRQGYGIVRNDGGSRLTHVIVYQRLVGPIPDGLELDHLCRRKACCNPAHMEPVTHRENVRRGDFIAGSANRAKMRCRQGHAYDAPNTRVYRGKRYCRACDRDRRAAERQVA